MASSIPGAVDGLYNCLARVVGAASVEMQVRELASTAKWYNPNLPVREVFHLWLHDRLEQERSAEWIFSFVRANERRLLCEAAGVSIPPTGVQSAAYLGSRVLGAFRLHVCSEADDDEIVFWDDLLSSLHVSAESCAVSARQRGERLLRVILFFYAALFQRELATVLTRQSKLRVPQPLRNAANNPAVALTDVIARDGVLDLGFLCLCLRDFSDVCTDSGVLHPSGSVLTFFDGADVSAFLRLATALQAYHHDNPSKVATRDDELRSAVQEIGIQVAGMIARRTLPTKTLVVETNCASSLGPVFRGRTRRESIVLSSESGVPPLGSVVRYIASCDRDFASCWWVLTPW